MCATGNMFTLLSAKYNSPGDKAEVIPRDNDITLEVMACRDATILVEIGPVGQKTKQYSITFGARQNKGSSIKVGVRM